MARTYRLDILSEVYSSKEFRTIVDAIREAKSISNANCCDVRVIRNNDDELIARIHHAFIDSNNKFHRQKVEKF